MRAVVVYESMFGNTRTIAEAVARGLGGADDVQVDVFEVAAAPTDLSDVALLVLGGPIHAWGMTRASTRTGARDEAQTEHIEVVSKGDGIREWIEGLPPPDGPVLVATFDTASEMPRWFPVGSAARPASRRLSKLGLESIAAPEHFFVHGKYGPVCDGEVERATAWGAGMRAALAEAA